jgi:hypothetical protein
MNDWTPYQTQDGRVYFFNAKTGESTWEKKYQPHSLSNVDKDNSSNPQNIKKQKKQLGVNCINDQLVNNEKSVLNKNDHVSNQPKVQGQTLNKQQNLSKEVQSKYKKSNNTSFHAKHLPMQKSNNVSQFLESNREESKIASRKDEHNLFGLKQSNILPGNNNYKSSNQVEQSNFSFQENDLVVAFHEKKQIYLQARIITVYSDHYDVQWLDGGNHSKVSTYNVKPFNKNHSNSVYSQSHDRYQYANKKIEKSQNLNKQLNNKSNEKSRLSNIKKDLSNFGAIRFLDDLEKWQARDGDGNILEILFNTYDAAKEHLLNIHLLKKKDRIDQSKTFNGKKDESIKNALLKENNKNNSKDSDLLLSPPSYILPMPEDLQSDIEDDDNQHKHRPVGREVDIPSTNKMERLVVTSSVELQSIYCNGFEEWKPSNSWSHEDVMKRTIVGSKFRTIFRTAVFTANGTIYTELLEGSSQGSNFNELTSEGIIFKKYKRVKDKSKFLIRLQHALEHQLAIALHKANFTKIAGETTPMYTFMSESSGNCKLVIYKKSILLGQELRVQGGKEIINYCGN